MNILVACQELLEVPELKGAMGQPEYQLLPATNGKEAQQAFAAIGPRVVITDWKLADMTAAKLYRSIGDIAAVPTTQWVVVAAPEQVSEVLNSAIGTDVDILVSPLTSTRIAAKVRASERIIKVAVELQSAQQRIRELEGRDPQTGSVSRATLVERLKLELERSWRDQRNLGVLLADVDEIAKINQNYTSQTGDALIRLIVGQISKATRPYDLVGRLGESAILFILPGCGGEAAEVLASRVRAAVASTQWNCLGHSISCTLSVGVTSISGVKSSKVEQILELADAALQKAKQAGGNTVQTVPVPDHLKTNQATLD